MKQLRISRREILNQGFSNSVDWITSRLIEAGFNMSAGLIIEVDKATDDYIYTQPEEMLGVSR